MFQDSPSKTTFCNLPLLHSQQTASIIKSAEIRSLLHETNEHLKLRTKLMDIEHNTYLLGDFITS